MFQKNTIALLKTECGRDFHAGAQICIYHKDKCVLDLAMGSARPDVEMLPQSITLWMSAGKPITAIAAMQLVDQKQITLDTRIVDVIPEFGILGKQDITLKHILTHTAGFRGPLNNFTKGTFQEILQRIYALRQEPHWIPGEKAGYHIGSSWFVLGELIQRITQCPLSEYVRNQVLHPVGAVNCSIGLSEEEIILLGDRLSYSTPDFPGNTRDGMIIPRPGANARGPIRELAMVYRSLLNNDGKLLSTDRVIEMISPQRVGMMDQTFKRVIDWSYGFKLDSKQYGAPEPYGYGAHASHQAFGHSGNQTACAFADPKHHLVVAWICTHMPGEDSHQERQNALNTAIYNDLGLIDS